jgi:DNA-binding NarL/FixJ family response regulator
MTTVLLLDWPPGVRRALRARLSLEADLEIVGEADDAAQALGLTEELTPDVVLVDAETPDLDLAALVRAIGRQHPRPAVVVLSLHCATMRHMLAGTPARVIGKEEGLVPLLRLVHGLARTPKERPARPRRKSHAV